MTPDEIRDLLPLYTLGLLDEPESAMIAGALASDAALHAEWQRLQTVLDVMASGVPQHAPPSELRQKILQQAIPTRRKVITLRQVVIMAAALLAIAFGILWALNRDSEPPSPVQAVLDSPDAVSIPLDILTDNETLAGEFIYSPSTGYGVLRCENLPVLDASASYQLWFIHADEAEPRLSGLVFRPKNTDWRGAIPLPETFGNYVAMGVTVEPAEGSPQPTTPPIFRAIFPPQDA